jgi:hypothetical protein
LRREPPRRRNHYKAFITKQPRVMKTPNANRTNQGKIGWALLWLIGIPIPVLLLFFVLRGCT